MPVAVNGSARCVGTALRSNRACDVAAAPFQNQNRLCGTKASVPARGVPEGQGLMERRGSNKALPAGTGSNLISVSDGGAQTKDGSVLDGRPSRVAGVRDVPAWTKDVLKIGLNRPARHHLRLIRHLDQGFAGPNRQSPSREGERARLWVNRA